YQEYYTAVNTYKTIMPDVTGLPAMDAVSLLENMGLKVKFNGVGVVKKQSVEKGVRIKPNQTVELES
ncbi:MAG: PASTA domain-containing protein, partial [Mangrovimonas sp.]|nr:PASTA domain-containing protein [Mangrovimonas sp.]